MADKANVILGVSLGTRTLGMALGSEHTLVEWRIRNFRETYSRKKVKKIWRAIEKTVDRYGVTVIGMKTPHSSLRSEGLNQCLKEITKKTLEKHVILYFYDIDTIEEQFLKSSVKNKSALAEKMADKYPELKREYFRLMTSQYHMKIFEATAVMELAFLETLQL